MRERERNDAQRACGRCATCKPGRISRPRRASSGQGRLFEGPFARNARKGGEMKETMKKAHLLILLLVLVSCRTPEAVIEDDQGPATPTPMPATPMPTKRPEDFQVIYNWDVGSLPPPSPEKGDCFLQNVVPWRWRITWNDRRRCGNSSQSEQLNTARGPSYFRISSSPVN